MTARVDFSALSETQRAGLALIGGKNENWIEVVCRGGRYYVDAVTSGTVTHGPEVCPKSEILFRCDVDFSGCTCFSFSVDGENFMRLGGNCTLINGFWKGVRPALYTYHTDGSGGYADWQEFIYEITE